MRRASMVGATAAAASQQLSVPRSALSSEGGLIRHSSSSGAPRALDRYGFFSDASASSETNGQHSASTRGLPTAAELSLEASRVRKWLAMLRSWDATRSGSAALLKRRVRKGVPDCLRGVVWPLLSGGAARRRAAPAGEYARLTRLQPSRADALCIALDLPRTYPNHVLFASPPEGGGGSGDASDADVLGPGQVALRNILSAYAVRNATVGYCQVRRRARLCVWGGRSVVQHT